MSPSGSLGEQAERGVVRVGYADEADAWRAGCDRKVEPTREEKAGR